MVWQTLAPSLLLIPVTLTPVLLSQAGAIYLIGALLLSGGFFYYAVRLALRKSNAVARQLLFASIAYLPLTFLLLVLSQL